MSITDELREYTGSFYLFRYKDVREKLDAIADRIDAEHERMHHDLTVGMKPMTEENMAADGWIRLPKDADGVPWHLGDRDEDGRMVTAIKLCFDGFWIRVGCTYRIAKQALHHHAPTVEDVLREFAEKMNENLGLYTGEAIDADEWRDADTKTVAEYAAKLRLAGDAE